MKTFSLIAALTNLMWKSSSFRMLSALLASFQTNPNFGKFASLSKDPRIRTKISIFLVSTTFFSFSDSLSEPCQDSYSFESSRSECIMSVLILRNIQIFVNFWKSLQSNVNMSQPCSGSIKGFSISSSSVWCPFTESIKSYELF